MVASLGLQGAVKAPDVSQVEIEEFRTEHFSCAAIQLFASEFLEPRVQYDGQHYEDYYEDNEEEGDDLGYYPDGVKRTLTDEQIAIFRHSELEALRRAEDKAVSRSRKQSETVSDTAEQDLAASNVTSVIEPELLEEGEDGEIESDTPQPNSSALSKKKKKKSKKNRQTSGTKPDHPRKGEQGWFRKTVKPDLRKRTWDVVETGMDSLDYDELDGATGLGSAHVTQRRKISYDD